MDSRAQCKALSDGARRVLVHCSTHVRSFVIVIINFFDADRPRTSGFLFRWLMLLNE